MKKLFTILLSTLSLLSCEEDIILVKPKQKPESSEEYYYSIHPGLFKYSKDSCQIVGLVGNRNINRRTLVVNDTIYIVKRNLIKDIHPYSLNGIYQGKMFQITDIK